MNITAGKFKGQKIIAPNENVVRPTLSKVRMAVFNVLQSMVDFEDATFLDMFGGSGVMGLEALSRGFKEVVVIEKDKKTSQILKKNYESLGLKANLHCGDALKYKTDKYFSVIYIDPPYYAGIYESVIQNLPNFGVCVIEHPEDVEIPVENVVKQKKYGDKLLTFISKED